MLRKVTIAIDGGVCRFKFDIGAITCIRLGLGPNAPISIMEATSSVLQAGNCRNNWFEIDVQEGTGNDILAVQIATTADVSCNFGPEGLPGYHVGPGRNVALVYVRDELGTICVREQGL